MRPWKRSFDQIPIHPYWETHNPRFRIAFEQPCRLGTDCAAPVRPAACVVCEGITTQPNQETNWWQSKRPNASSVFAQAQVISLILVSFQRNSKCNIISTEIKQRRVGPACSKLFQRQGLGTCLNLLYGPASAGKLGIIDTKSHRVLTING